MGQIIGFPKWHTSVKHWCKGLPRRLTRQGKRWSNYHNSSHIEDENKDEDHDDVACSEEQDESDDDDNCSVSALPKPGEVSSSDIEDYGPYWNNSSESMPNVDHLLDWILYICILPGSFYPLGGDGRILDSYANPQLHLKIK